MTFISRSFVRCLLCQGALPSTKTEVAQAHFEEQHRAYFNIDFLLKSSFLDENDIFKTLDFMAALILSTISNKERHTIENSFQINHKSEVIEGNTKEQNESRDESFIGRLPMTLHDPIKELDMFTSKYIETEDNSLCATAEPENCKNKVLSENHQSELIQENTYVHNKSKDESFVDRLPITVYDPVKVKDLDMFPSKSSKTEDNSLCESAEPENGEKKVLIEDKSKESNSMDTFPIAKLDKNTNKDEHLVFHCLPCNKLYTSEKNLKVHTSECHDIRKKICHICDKEMIGNKRLRNHMKTHKKGICEFCNKISSFGYLKQHIERCKKEKLWLICTFCNLKTLSKTDFKKHFKKMHNNECLNYELEEKIYQCDLCDYVSNDRRNVHRHKMVHSIIKHECTYCERKFKSSFLLNKHISSAHFEKKQIKVEPKIYYCDICDYKAKRRFDVKRHQTRHSNTKPRKPEIFCEICNKKFSRNAKLNSHMETCKYKDHIFISM